MAKFDAGKPAALALFALSLVLPGAPAVAQTGELVNPKELRVCADPNNLPFSNEHQEGFENKIAMLMGRELSLPVSYVWFPQIVGFVRNTLRAHQCDLVMGAVAGDDIMQTTNPYYYTSYMMVYRSEGGRSLSGIDDPQLQTLRIGVVGGTPPSNLLVRRGLISHARPYALTVDTRYESPPHRMILDLVKGEIDVALLWGPIAGYYQQRDHLPLTLQPLQSDPGAPRMDYHIAMGVRAGEPEWRRRINAAIQQHQDEITQILKEYGVPLLDPKGKLIDQRTGQ